MKLLLLVILCPLILNGQYVLKGTTIVARLSKDSIWFATDSRVVNNGNNSALDWCKIVNEKKYLAAGEGYTGFVLQNKKMYDIRSVLRNCIINGKNKDAIVSLLKDSIKTYLSAVMNALSIAGRQKALNTGRIASVLLATFINNAPYAVGIEFYLMGSIFSWSIEPKSREGSYTEVGYISIGYHGAIDAFIAKNRMYLNEDKTPMASKLKKLIEMECATHPADVAPPIDVVGMGKSGVKWYFPNSKKRCF
jgi:hypothetical protein